MPTGSLPTAVVAGDFNEDGKVDLAISNGADNTVYVLLGQGDGTFALPEVLYTSGQSPVWIVAAKLKASGHLDLVVVDGDSKQAEAFTGNGDGTFQAPSVVATFAQTPSYIAAGDLDHDGNADLVVGLTLDPDSTEPGFEALYGDGTGQFPTTVLSPSSTNDNDSPAPVAVVAVGDTNNDGYPDVVVGFALGGGLSFLNQGGRSFKQVAAFGPDDPLVSVALADMNGDGCLDAVQTGAYGLLTIAKGTCDGSFTEGNPTAEAGDVGAAVSVADVDGDGHLDVVLSGAFFDDGAGGPDIGAFGGYTIAVLKGDGHGGLAAPATYRAGPDDFSLVIADLSGNGKPDIIAVSQTESKTTLLTNDGSGGYGAPSGEAIGYVGGVTNAPFPLTNPQVLDLNGDGKPDVLVLEYGQNGLAPYNFASLLNDGTGKLLPPVRTAITVGPVPAFPTFTAGPFRSSHAADAVYIETYQPPFDVAFLAGKGDGSFAAPVTLATLGNPVLVTTGDFNADGKLDFAVYEVSATAAPTNQIDVFLGDGNGGFHELQPVVFTPLSPLAPYQLIAGDFNHDGKLDLLIGYNANGGYAGQGTDLDLMLGNGDGTLRAPTTLIANFGPVAVGDVNHDGYLDLIQSASPAQTVTAGALQAAGGPYNTPVATVYLGQPGGGFIQGATYIVPEAAKPSFNPALLGDFNGDGNLDMAVPYEAYLGPPWEQQLAIFAGVGDGTFLPSGIPYQLPAYDTPIIGADFRGVGRTDLLDLIGSTSAINTISAGSTIAASLVMDRPLAGSAGSATISLAQPATEGEAVTLAASDPAVQVPGTVTFHAGDTEQTFSFSIGSGADRTHMLSLTASSASYATTDFAAYANSNLAASVTASIDIPLYSGPVSLAVSPGSSVDFVFNLQSENGYSGYFNQLSCTGLPPGASCTFAEPGMLLAPGGTAFVAASIITSSSTPMGSYPVQVVASNGLIAPAVAVTFGVGDFSVSVNPTVLVANSASGPSTTATANFVNGYYNGVVQFTCSGLPATVTCLDEGSAFPASPNTQLIVSDSADMLAVGDYPFQVNGADNALTRSTSAILRVGTYTAQLNQTAATVQAGASTTFNVTLTSINHFTNQNIVVSCNTNAAVICSASPAYATLNDGGTTVVVLTISANASTAVSKPPAPYKQGRRPRDLSIAVCLAIWVFPVGVGWRKRQRFLIALCAFAITFAISACGGGTSAAIGGGGTGGSGGSGGGGGGSSTTASVNVEASAPISNAQLQVNVGTVTLTIAQ